MPCPDCAPTIAEHRRISTRLEACQGNVDTLLRLVRRMTPFMTTLEMQAAVQRALDDIRIQREKGEAP